MNGYNFVSLDGFENIQFKYHFVFDAKFLKGKPTWEDQYGDILYMDKFIRPYDKKFVEGKQRLLLGYISANTVKAASAVGINVYNLETYECPYTDREYYWAIPVEIYTEENSEIYNDYFKVFETRNSWCKDMAADKEWNKKCIQ